MIGLSHPIIGDEEIEAVAAVLRSGWLTGGPEVEAFEAAMAARLDVGHAVAVSNGTTALEVAFRALGIGPGDEVIVPSFTFIATANAVRIVGATPVFAEVDPVSYCLSAADVEPLLSDRTAAVVAVHLYGNVADVAALRELCNRRSLALVEDAAQAIGSALDGRAAGTFGDAATFSFYPTKNITTGEGGMIVTSDPSVADRLRLIRNQGQRVRYEHELLGTNARMTEIAAAIGRIQLGRLDDWQQRRSANAAAYDLALADAVATPQVAAAVTHAYHQYTIRCTDRPAMIAALTSAEIGHGIYYPKPCHLQKPYSDIGGSLPVTERISGEVLSIPVRPDLTLDERGQVIEAVLRGAG